MSRFQETTQMSGRKVARESLPDSIRRGLRAFPGPRGVVDASRRGRDGGHGPSRIPPKVLWLNLHQFRALVGFHPGAPCRETQARPR